VIDLSATCLELAGVEKPESVQGQSFVPLLKDPAATVREMVFSEHNWHVYRNHERMVRFGDFLYIKNNFPNQPNLCYESDNHYPAGRELWMAQAAGKTTRQQQQVFANPCPEEELFRVSKDSHQLSNLAGNPEYAATLAQARAMVAAWTKQTGDTIPENPTPNRHEPPYIEDGKIVPARKAKQRNPHAEMPGAASMATEINHPGPITLPK